MRVTDQLDLDWLPPAHTLLAGRYRIGALLGTGGMAAVVEAEHVALGERVAIKFLHPKQARDAEAQQRFVREARISSLIRSEHVVRVLDAGTEGELPYLVMEFLQGEDLAGLIGRSGAQPLELAIDCILQAAEALGLAHAAGVVHRDIKPSNLWLARHRDGTPHLKVLDFGISKLLHPGGIDPSLTETASVFGSPTYMSPEQIRSAKRVDARADVWALGVVLHELLTGSLPFVGDSVGGVLASITADLPQAVRALRDDVPPAVEAVVLACLEKDPARRITLRELASELRPYASAAGARAAESLLATPEPVPQTEPWRARLPTASPASTLSASTLRQSTKRGSSPWLLAAVGLLAVAVTAALAVQFSNHPSAHATPALEAPNVAAGDAEALVLTSAASSAAPPSSATETTVAPAVASSAATHEEPTKHANRPLLGPIAAPSAAASAAKPPPSEAPVAPVSSITADRH